MIVRGRDGRYSCATIGAMRPIVTDSDVPEVALSELEAAKQVQLEELYHQEKGSEQ